MNCLKYCRFSTEDIYREFEVSPDKGLTATQAGAGIKKYGLNSTTVSRKTWFDILLRQFKSAFIYLLFAAALIALLLGESLDAIIILSFVFINVGLGFYQEFKSEQTLKYLSRFVVTKTSVIRDGAEHLIDSSLLVPGDLVSVETGDIIPADLRLIYENNVLLNESSLTGEPVQVSKNIHESAEDIKEIHKASNILFSGTTVVEGSAKGIVVATGKNTEFGKVSELTTKTPEESGFEKQIDKFSRFILIMTMSTIVLVFFTHLLFKHNLSVGDLIIFSIALAVGVIPEAMPLVTTFSLSKGASLLAKKDVVVKRLSAIEDLGGIQVMCTDKTGTITENKLSVSNIFSDNADRTLFYALAAAGFIEEDQTPNNSFDLAIYNKADPEIKKRISNLKMLYEIPFNPNRRRNSVLIQAEDDKEIVVRGAIESILPHVKKLNNALNEQIINWALKEGTEGKRVLAVGSKSYDGESYTVDDEKHDINFLGLISFDDPIKPSTLAAVKKAKNFGIKLKVLTGDSAEVAGAVAYKSGITGKKSEVITGEEFFSLNDSEQEKALQRHAVFARVSPEQKFKIIQMLEKHYDVGYLGDGINDAPALKASSVAIVVDTAADVSREVADIVLLRNDLQVIVEGIALGRKTFVNVTNYIKATLASNFGNFYAMAFATLVIDFLPMLPIQILFLNLLSDFPMVSISTDNVDDTEVKAPKNYDVREILLISIMLGIVSTLFDFIMFSVFKNGGEHVLQTYWFMGSIFTELTLIFSIRTKLNMFRAKTLPSVQILILTGLAIFITILLPFTSVGNNVFKFVTPTFRNLGILFTIVTCYLVSTETVKNLYYRHFDKTEKNII